MDFSLVGDCVSRTKPMHSFEVHWYKSFWIFEIFFYTSDFFQAFTKWKEEMLPISWRDGLCWGGFQTNKLLLHKLAPFGLCLGFFCLHGYQFTKSCQAATIKKKEFSNKNQKELGKDWFPQAIMSFLCFKGNHVLKLSQRFKKKHIKTHKKKV